VKVVTIVGARPQFIKTGPTSSALRRVAREVLVHTGQHYDSELSDAFFRDLELPRPDYHLGVGSGPHGLQTGTMLTRIEEVLLKERPDWVLVFGDTNSTLAGALAAAKLNLPVAHVEAGLRSYNRRMPEEVNRVLTDHMSTLLFCPTEQAVKNLAAEGLVSGVHNVGDVMYDSLRRMAPLALRHSTIAADMALKEKGYVVATIHRPVNADDPGRLTAILTALGTSPRPVVFPLHPRTRHHLEVYGLKDLLRPPIITLPPVSYMDMLALEQGASVIVTDSGGVQKEAFMLGVPCITCRAETEWTETVTAGANVLVDADPEKLRVALANPPRSARASGVYGDGRASERLVAIMLSHARPG